MHTDSAAVIDYGVDYITVTATVPPRTISLLDVAKENLEAEAASGNEVTEWRGLGYHGLNCGGASYGVGPQGVIARLTSGSARENWRTLYTWGMKCTRIDLQVTMRSEREAPAVLGDAWETALAKWLQRKRRTPPKLVSGPYGPESIRFCSRQSDRCGRMYDKGVESKLDYYLRSVRSEAEFKGQRSDMIAKWLLEQPRTLAPVAAHVSKFFYDQGLALKVADGSLAHFSVPAKDTDCKRKLKYLRSSVSPMIKFLVDQVGVEAVIEALELRPFLYTGSGEPNAALDYNTGG